jgi:hypothetical protein
MKYTKKWMVVPYQEKQQQHVEPQLDKIDLNLQNILKRKNLAKDVKVKIHNHLLGMKIQKPNFFQKDDEPQIETTNQVFNEPTNQDTTMIDVDDVADDVVLDENELNKTIENVYNNFLNRSLRNLLPKVLLENPDILMDALNSGANLTRFKLNAKRKFLKDKNDKSDSPVPKQDKLLKTPLSITTSRLSKLAQPKSITPKVTPNSNITQRKAKQTNNRFEDWSLLNERK